MDGFFGAQNMQMKDAENDVPLSDGQGYMVKRNPYRVFLGKTPEPRQVLKVIS